MTTIHEFLMPKFLSRKEEFAAAIIFVLSSLNVLNLTIVTKYKEFLS